jgi:hypothetical protein
VAAVLEQRYSAASVPNHHGRTTNVQALLSGSFIIGSTCFHVAAAATSDAIRNCAANLEAGVHPVLAVPRDQVRKARHLAEDKHVDTRLTIVAIEDFIAVNIIEQSAGEQQRFFEVLNSIIEKYNRRIREAEVDMSLQIEIR